MAALHGPGDILLHQYKQQFSRPTSLPIVNFFVSTPPKTHTSSLFKVSPGLFTLENNGLPPWDVGHLRGGGGLSTLSNPQGCSIHNG